MTDVIQNKLRHWMEKVALRFFRTPLLVPPPCRGRGAWVPQ